MTNYFGIFYSGVGGGWKVSGSESDTHKFQTKKVYFRPRISK